MSLRLLPHNVDQKVAASLEQVGHRMVAGLLSFAFVAFLSGCGALSSSSLSQINNVPPTATVTGVPFFAQDELQCGPAALAMALNWSGLSILPSEVSKEVYSPNLKGSLQSSLIGAARRHGRVAYPITGGRSLLTEVSASHPVIVLVNLGFAWFPKWHYAVVIGYDQKKGKIILHSGLKKGEVLSFWTFTNIWKRSGYWGLLVLPPDQMPENVEKSRWLDAVSGLENTQHWQAAAVGYATALERWNHSFIAWMGLGHSQYQLQDFKAAAKAFQQASLIQPQNGMAWNNLAHVLAQQGKFDEALSAAQQAVDLGGPFKETFQQTFAEIKQSQSALRSQD